MKRSTEAAWERTMKIHEVMLRAMAKRITWWQAAEIIGISCRQMRRWHRRFEEHGYEGLRDRRRGRESRSGWDSSKWKKCCGYIRSNTLISMCALSRKAIGRTRDQAELYLGEAGFAGSWFGEEGPKAGSASQTTTAATTARDVVAHRWQSAPVVL